MVSVVNNLVSRWVCGIRLLMKICLFSVCRFVFVIFSEYSEGMCSVFEKFVFDLLFCD